VSYYDLIVKHLLLTIIVTAWYPQTHCYLNNIAKVYAARTCSITVPLMMSPHNFQMEIPGDQDTTYWCVAVRIPEDVRTQQHYIYKVGSFDYLCSSSTFSRWGTILQWL